MFWTASFTNFSPTPNVGPKLPAFFIYFFFWNISLQFNYSVLSDSLQSHRLRQARLLCSSPTPGVCSNSHPLSRWCHPTISSSVTPLLLLLSIFPSIRVFPSGWALHIRGQRNGASASASDLPVKVQGWFPLGLIGFILLSRGLPCKDLSLNIYRFK